MKKTLTLMVAALLCCATAMAKDLKVLVVKTTPEMHCNGCETKIKSNIRFTAGVKKIETNLETKEVAVTYDADKTDQKTLLAAFRPDSVTVDGKPRELLVAVSPAAAGDGFLGIL